MKFSNIIKCFRDSTLIEKSTAEIKQLSDDYNLLEADYKWAIKQNEQLKSELATREELLSQCRTALLKSKKRKPMKRKV